MLLARNLDEQALTVLVCKQEWESSYVLTVQSCFSSALDIKRTHGQVVFLESTKLPLPLLLSPVNSGTIPLHFTLSLVLSFFT